MAKKRDKSESKEIDMPVIRKKNKTFGNFIFTVFLIGGAIAIALYSVLALFLESQPPIQNLETYNPNIVTQIYSSNGKLIKTFTPYRFEKVSLNQIPDYLKQALISTEDKNFYSHHGYDILGLVRSVFVNLKSQKVKQGASTITQQLARVLFLSNEKTYDRKIRELIIAARIEKTLSKDQILEMYLNHVYFGSGSYGVAAAAETYFGKQLEDLTLAECALIAGLPQAPSVYSPFNNLKLSVKRRNQVLKRMYTMQNITEKQYKEAVDEPVNLVKGGTKNGTSNLAQYFISYVLKELEVLGYDEKDIVNSGYRIYTTLDYTAQKAANEAINKNLDSWKMTGPNQQAALFSISPITGKILAYNGGKNYSQSQYDRVVQAIRPPGSSFKPIVYAVAVENGAQPDDLIDDTPVTIGDWSPGNYGDKYRGKIPLYRALAVSSNVAAVRLIRQYGVRAVIQMAKNLGITTPIEYDMTISLGSNGVKLYDMVVAYSAFANGGFRVTPYSVERIEDSRGKIIYKADKTKVSKVLQEQTSAILTSMLKRVITDGTGKRANIGRPMAGKTGTTNDYKDAWFIGYTPEVVTGVWVGNDNNNKMGTLTGGSLPAAIWKSMMSVATESTPVSDFSYESGENDEDKNGNSESSDNDAVETPPQSSSVLPETEKEEPPSTNKVNEEQAIIPPKREAPPKVDPKDFKSIPISSMIKEATEDTEESSYSKQPSNYSGE